MSLSDQKLHAMGRLSAGQMNVLHRVAQHKSSKEIARELDISPHTVDQRVRRIHSILGVSTRSEAARVYMAAHNSLEEVDADLCGGLIYQGPSLSEPHLSAQVGSSFDEWNPESDRAEKFLREAQAPYFAGDLNSQPQRSWLSVLFEVQKTNALSPLTRTFVIVLIMLLSLLALSALVGLAEGISRIF